MEKKTYYIEVGSGSVLTESTNSPYEFKIEATEEEIHQLLALFDARDRADWGTFIRSHIPIMPYHLDKENDQYDHNLYEIYQMIHELGSPETKNQIELLGILH